MVGTKQGLCMDVILFMLIVTTLLRYSGAQEIIDNDGNSVEAGNSSEIITCIGQYTRLQAHVLNNERMMDILTATFFTTGKAASKFVRITYNFQISNGSNVTDDYDSPNCSSHHHSTYIWSESSLYLLGPKSLYWFTLFAINVQRVDVSIQLPCLFHDVYNTLLSRLTYMV